MAAVCQALSAISIHALLAESDMRKGGTRQSGHKFLSTLSLRRATFEYMQVGTGILFLSTLSLRRATGNDLGGRVSQGFLSTLSLRRATVIREPATSRDDKFLSTLSLRRATTGRILRAKLRPISIHALLAESDALRQLQSALC